MSLTPPTYGPPWRLVPSPGGITVDRDYLELVGTGKLRLTYDNPSAERVFMCRWSVKDDFISSLLGFSILGGAIGGGGFVPDGTIVREIPDQHPEALLYYCTEVSCEGYGNLGEASDFDKRFAAYEYAKVTAHYTPVPYNVLPDYTVEGGGTPDVPRELDRFVQRDIKPTAQFLTTQGVLRFATDPTHTIQQPPGFVTGLTKLAYTWHGVPSLPATAANPNANLIPPTLDAIMELQGTINEDLFDRIYWPGTVLFEGCDAQLIMPKTFRLGGLTGQGHTWNLTYHFTVKDNGAGVGADPAAGWNYHFDARACPPVWDLVVTQPVTTCPSDQAVIYQPGDFDRLFEIPV